jgi:FtsH-binding integral membrane protein
MQRSNPNYTIVRSQQKTATASFMSRVYFWMMGGIFISGATAFYIASNADLINYIAQSNGIFFGVFILQLIAVVTLSAAAQRMSVAMASAIYALYATLVGVTFSVLFLAYSIQSIGLAFFTTSFAFAGLSVFGFVTKRDLGPVGSFCMMGLFGMIAVALLGLFFPSMMSNSMQLTISVIGVLVFSGLTAYDTQKIKALQYQFASEEQARKAAINGALILYLDFINLFISLLRLMGNRR